MDLSVELTKLLTTARREAVLLGHSMVGSEHLLLALMQRRGTEAAWVLEQSGWDPEALRQILRTRGSGTPGLPMVQGFSDHALGLLAGAALEARRLAAAEVSPEHLLLAITRLEDSTAAQLLLRHGTSLDCVFTDLYEDLQAGVQHRPEAERGVNMRLLEQFCVDMVEKAADADPVVGRDREIDTVIAILCRKNKNNPALIGEPGVGKTAIAEGLAQRMLQGLVPDSEEQAVVFPEHGFGAGRDQVSRRI